MNSSKALEHVDNNHSAHTEYDNGVMIVSKNPGWGFDVTYVSSINTRSSIKGMGSKWTLNLMNTIPSISW